MTYIEPDIGDDEATILTDIIDRLEAAFPGWLPVRGGLIYISASGIAFVLAEFYAVLRLMGRSIFRVYGREVAQFAPTEASPSTATSTWTSATLSFTVDAGTLVGIDDGAGGLIPAEVVDDVSTTDGSAEGVELITQETGERTAGLTGPVVVLDALGYDPTVVLDAATVGGQDEEQDEAYLSRLSERLQLSSDDVILGEDAAILARQTTGVYRALAVDNYNADTDDDDAAGHITVATQAADGGAVDAGVNTAVQAAIEAATVLGLTVHVVDVEQEAVKVDYEGVAYSGYDPGDVEFRVDAAIAAYLASAGWGRLPFEDERSWQSEPTVRYLEVAQAINQVEGFHYLTSLEIALQAGTLGTSNVTLGAEPWVVAEPGTITGTVTGA